MIYDIEKVAKSHGYNMLLFQTDEQHGNEALSIKVAKGDLTTYGKASVASSQFCEKQLLNLAEDLMLFFSKKIQDFRSTATIE
ncbi:hypothetical protein DC20_05980 [Rufibacter tibetensis]|uniref:Uncharacterized protein n=1 Tax=Rufibacter tibetensis TaxID=512763 RepID=A0A0P0CTQ4_9BACT|nr:hypothetical protein DC20_05980 [Rufibacter tibetensis]